MLSLNRHFISSKHPGMKPNQQSQTACSASCDAVIAIVRQFRSQPGTRPPVTLLYALSTVTITILTTSSGGALRQQDARLPFIMKAMAECTPHFRLAGEMRSKLARYLEARTPMPGALPMEPPRHVQPSSENVATENTLLRDSNAQSNNFPPLGFPADLLEQQQPMDVGASVQLMPSTGFDEGFGQFGDSFLSDAFQEWFYSSAGQSQ